MSYFFKFFVIPVFIDLVILLLMYTKRECSKDLETEQQGGCASTIALTIAALLAMVAFDTLLKYTIAE